MTEVYLIRHSKTLKINNLYDKDCLQVQNEKQILSIEGEKLANEKLDIDELKNIDLVYSSNYVRAISTAKYISENNNLTINICCDFGERKFGVNNYDEIPDDFYTKQFNFENYKLENGESQVEVRNRMYNALINILEENKKIVVVSHSTAITFLLMKWCDITSNNIKFNNKVISPVKIDNCDIFKLVFNNKNLISIEKVSE